jgi:non-specific serine/threonine protein kinase/serine/threonine-protein kinase
MPPCPQCCASGKVTLMPDSDLSSVPPTEVPPTEESPPGPTLAYESKSGGDGGTTGVFAPPLEKIGPYETLEVLGKGGMGIVYLAEQKAPVQRQVALKLIKLGMDTHEVIARFQSERQVLALLNHPNIARVFDAGSTEGGRPYFVMEYVPGVSLTRYCDDRRLGVEERVELLIQVCEAVQHAHQKGVIHRDLKPSNVLVMVQDDRPVPKVIDFGLAKVIAGEPTCQSLHTQQGMILGTPAYMSPEQADAGARDVDTRTDVYSLGAMLYELLVGAAPFDPLVLRNVNPVELHRIIREQQPPRPSTRISTLTRQPGYKTRKRPAELRRLLRQLRGDLDWITLKALEKDRTRRYATPSELADDLRRYLRGEAVLARPPSLGYRLGKFVRKYRGAVAAAAAVLLALVGGLVATTSLYLKASAAQRLAEDHRREAEAINDFLVTEMLNSAAPEQARGRKIPVEEVLANAAARIDHAFLNQPEAEARVRHTLGRAYTSLGLAAQAEPHLQRALELYRQVRGPEDAETLRVETSLVGALGLQGDPAKRQAARALCEECLRICRRVLPDNHPVTLTALSNSANLLSQHGEHAEAERVYEQVVDGRRSLANSDPRALLAALNSQAGELFLQGKLPKAERLYQEVLESSQRLLGPDHPDTLNALHNLALTLGAQPDRVQEARPLAEKALEARRRILGPEHWHTLAALNTLAGLFFQQGDFAEAGRLYGDLAATSQRVLGRDHDLSLTAQNNLAKALAGQGKFREAEKLYRQTLEDRRRVLGAGHPATLSTLNNLAYLLHREGQLAEAEAAYRQFLELRHAVPGQEPQDVLYAMNGLAGVLLDREPPNPGHLAEAESLCRRVVAARRQHAALGRRYLANALDTLGRALVAKGQPAEAEPLLREAVDIYAKNPRAGDWDAANAQSLLGECLARGGRREEAEPLILAAYHSLQANPNTPPQRTRQALRRIIQLYEAWPKPKQAAEWRGRLEPP